MERDESGHGSRPGFTRRSALARGAVLGAATAVGRFGRVGAQEAPPEIESFDGVMFAEVDGTELLVDIRRAVGLEGLRPAVVIVHGGGLFEGTRSDLGDAGYALAGEGYVTFNVDYRLFSREDGSNPWPAQLDDVQTAVRWIRANAATYDVDPDRVGALGWSSGGQLVGFLGTRETRDNSDPELADFSSKVQCVVAMGALFDMTIPYAYEDRGLLDIEILGGTLEDRPDDAAFQDFSPLSFVDGESAPFLILQEGNEDEIPYAHAREMVAALQAAGVQVTYGWYPDYDHGAWASWVSEAGETLAFFARYLLPDPASA